MSKLTVVTGSGGDWEALYVDGVLTHQGHSVTEQAYEAAGIETIDSSPDLLQGATGRATSEACAPTLTELARREEEREAAAIQAADLRREAQRLLDAAGAIDGRPLTVAHKDDLVRGVKADRWTR